MKCFKIFVISLILVFLAVAKEPELKAEFNLFQGMKKMDADPNKDYSIKESDGLWFIMAKTFRGNNARDEAMKLLLEFRKKYKLESFMFKYDPDQADMDELASQRQSTRKYKYNTERSVEYSVLVGKFPSVDDVELQKTYLTIKRSKPECLKEDSASINLVKKYEEMAKKDPEYAGYGPLGGAIIVPNPMIDKDFYCQKGVVDPFVEKLNSDSKYSLLNNEKLYTLRVATFRGDCSLRKMNDKEINLRSKLKFAGMKAAALCDALRQKGVEAWEFHDRDSSFVTIGSFDTYGASRADGYIELNPEINELMKKYQGTAAPGTSGAFATKAIIVEITDSSAKNKKQRMEIPFDIQPLIIAVPQRPQNFKKALQAIKQQEKDRHVNEVKKEELNFAESANARNFRKNFRKQTVESVQTQADQSPQNNGLSATANTPNGQNGLYPQNGAPTSTEMVPNRTFSQNFSSGQRNASLTANNSNFNQEPVNGSFPNQSVMNSNALNQNGMASNGMAQTGQTPFNGQTNSTAAPQYSSLNNSQNNRAISGQEYPRQTMYPSANNQFSNPTIAPNQYQQAPNQYQQSSNQYQQAPGERIAMNPGAPQVPQGVSGPMSATPSMSQPYQGRGQNPAYQQVPQNQQNFGQVPQYQNSGFNGQIQNSQYPNASQQAPMDQSRSQQFDSSRQPSSFQQQPNVPTGQAPVY